MKLTLVCGLLLLGGRASADITVSSPHPYDDPLALLAGRFLCSASGQTAVTDRLAPVALGARVLQSLIHVASTSNLTVLGCGSIFFVQLFVCVYWPWGLLQEA